MEANFESLVIFPWILFHSWMLILLFAFLQSSMFNPLYFQFSHSEVVQTEEDELIYKNNIEQHCEDEEDELICKNNIKQHCEDWLILVPMTSGFG